MQERSWANKYRPSKFSQIAGQKRAVQLLTGMLKTDSIPNAIIFSGATGTGKTTLALMLARYINCETGDACGKCSSCSYKTKHPDVMEINAASERGIDEARNLIQQAKYMPQFKMRVIILDELQGATPQALSALLIPLESPPKHTLYCICTTDPQKLPAASLTRLTKVNLVCPTPEEIASRLASILKAEKKKMPSEALLAISNASNGYVREAVNLLQSTVSSMAVNPKASVEELLDTINASSDVPTIKLATRLLIALYKDNAKVAVNTLFGVKEILPFINQCIWFNQFQLGLATNVQNSSHLWFSPVNKEFASAVKKYVPDGVKLSKLLQVQTALVDVRGKLFTTAVSEISLLLSHLSQVKS
jgi:DNA polymerase-3 subunit gamma/tau